MVEIPWFHYTTVQRYDPRIFGDDEPTDLEISDSGMGDDRMHVYYANLDGARYRVVLWLDEEGSVSGYDTDCPELSSAHIRSIVEFAEREGLLHGELQVMAETLPERIMDHPDFEKLYENEKWHGEDNGEIYLDIVGEFLDELFSAYPRDIFDIADIACESCLRCTEFDASEAVELIKRRFVQEDLVIEDRDFMRIFEDTDRSESGFWVIDDVFIPEPKTVYRLYSRICCNYALTPHQQELADALLGMAEDCSGLAEYMLSMKDEYYSAEALVHDELGKGHFELARALAERLSESPMVEGRELEMGRLRRLLGLDDEPGFFIDAFLAEPGGKRLIDVMDAHPDLDIPDLLSESWRLSKQDDVSQFIFFADNGLSDEVAEVLEGWSESRLTRSVADATDDWFTLAEILLKEGRVEMAAVLSKEILAHYKKRHENPNQIARTLWFMDRIADEEDVPSWFTEHCRKISSWKNEEIWDIYGNPPNSHFRESRRCL